MKYSEIEPMCRRNGPLRGCPHDGLGCTGGKRCSINSEDDAVRRAAWESDKFGPDFVCQKREWAIKKANGVA